jgi:hypothetical protein
MLPFTVVCIWVLYLIWRSVCSVVLFCVINAKVVLSMFHGSKMCYTSNSVQSNISTENQTFLTKI